MSELEIELKRTLDLLEKIDERTKEINKILKKEGGNGEEIQNG